MLSHSIDIHAPNYVAHPVIFWVNFDKLCVLRSTENDGFSHYTDTDRFSPIDGIFCLAKIEFYD
jgi:hypothetical protein